MALAAALAAAGCGGSGSDTSSGEPTEPAPPSAGGPARIGVTDSLATVRFDRPVPALRAGASLQAARNEFESFQVVIGAHRGLRGVEVSTEGPLRGPDGAEIAARNLTIYREAAYRVGGPGKPPSDAEGGPGLWPDALIPERDYYYGERRDAFPVDVAAGATAVAWVDILVPEAQPSGSYSGAILVRNSSGVLARVPVEVEVLDFEIPSTSSLRSAFFADPFEICRAFTGSPACPPSDPATWARRELFVRAGLENRISISNGFPQPATPVEKQLFDRYAAPLIDGGDPELRLPGARLSSLDASTSCATDSTCLGAWRQAARRHGFGDRFFAYLCDEPAYDPAAWAGCAATARQADSIWPGVPKLLTASIQSAERAGGGRSGALGYTNLLVAPIYQIAAGGRSLRGSYDSFLRQPGRELWLYTSCLSFSCNAEGADDPVYAGWPGYAIDEPASQSRAMGWLAFEYRASGELYYETAKSLPHAWQNQYFEGGNGDGNLFYPGLPQGGPGVPAIGGSREIPIESIRLKRIRDGREDYEYLRLLEQRGEGGEAMAVVRSLFGAPGSAAQGATVSAAALESARRRLAAMIAG
jgi:hypothetical protein